MQDQPEPLAEPAARIADFDPVPRRTPYHTGWTPERQRAFIEALADTGSVATAARMVNMPRTTAYRLRRHPQADGFRRAWDAALGFGVQMLKDEAFERAMTGELIPVFAGGKLQGFRRKKNDALLMFILQHYGEEAGRRRVTVNYHSTRATAGAASSAPLPSREREGPKPQAWEGEGATVPNTLTNAEASTTSVTITGSRGRDGNAAEAATRATLLEAFQGVPLDPQAQAEILQALTAAAERNRELGAIADRGGEDAILVKVDDPAEHFIRVDPERSHAYQYPLETGIDYHEVEPFEPGEPFWEGLEAEPRE